MLWMSVAGYLMGVFEGKMLIWEEKLREGVCVEERCGWGLECCDFLNKAYKYISGDEQEMLRNYIKRGRVFQSILGESDSGCWRIWSDYI